MLIEYYSVSICVLVFLRGRISSIILVQRLFAGCAGIDSPHIKGIV